MCASVLNETISVLGGPRSSDRCFEKFTLGTYSAAKASADESVIRRAKVMCRVCLPVGVERDGVQSAVSNAVSITDDACCRKYI